MGPEQLKVAETILGASAGVAEAVGAVRSADVQARQLEANAAAARATAAATAAETRRQGRLTESAARAAQAGSGGTTTDAQALMQRARIGEVTRYNELSALFEGDVRATNYLNQAAMERQQGRASAISSGIRTVSTVLKNSSDIYDNFKKKKTPTTPVTAISRRSRYMTDQGPTY